MFDLKGLSLRPDQVEEPAPDLSIFCADAVIPGTYPKHALRSRNGVAFVICRQFSAARKTEQLASLKTLKQHLPAAAIGLIADEMAACLRSLIGDLQGFGVASVACGHSRRPDCLSFMLASQVADRLGLERVFTFRDRFMSGSSHPKEFAKLPPLEFAERPTKGVLVVDDLATSGFHMHEALSAIRAAGHPALGIVWLSGVKAD